MTDRFFKFLCDSIGCSVPSYQIWVGDGYCDDDTNTAECQWDGGDCCGPDVYTYYCSVCACHEDSETTTTTVATTPTTTKTPIAIGPGTKCYNLSAQVIRPGYLPGVSARVISPGYPLGLSAQVIHPVI